MAGRRACSRSRPSSTWSPRHLGKPLEEVRRRNFYGHGRDNVTPYGMTVEDNIIETVIDDLDRAVDLKAWRDSVTAFNKTSPIVKKGLATMPVKFGISFNRPALNQAGALVHVYMDGSVTLNHGGTEMGQGLFIKVAQVVAETFQIDVDNIKITATTTGKVPNTSPTAASSGSDLNGMAAQNAAEQIKDRMADVAAEQFNVPKGEITFSSNRIYAGNRSISFAELAALSWEKRVSLSATGFYRTPKIHWDFASNSGRPFYYFTYGVAAAEVAIDTLTGEMRVLRAELLQDCGESLNPAIDLGQIEGAFVQGMGWLTTEELVWDNKGKLRTHGPSTYKIPGSRDVPPVFNARILQNAPNTEETVFRSKAVGEPPLMLALSVWLAVRDAISSLSDYKLAPVIDAPTTPDRVLAAVDEIRARAGDPDSVIPGRDEVANRESESLSAIGHGGHWQFRARAVSRRRRRNDDALQRQLPHRVLGSLRLRVDLLLELRVEIADLGEPVLLRFQRREIAAAEVGALSDRSQIVAHAFLIAADPLAFGIELAALSLRLVHVLDQHRELCNHSLQRRAFVFKTANPDQHVVDIEFGQYDLFAVEMFGGEARLGGRTSWRGYRVAVTGRRILEAFGAGHRRPAGDALFLHDDVAVLVRARW